MTKVNGNQNMASFLAQNLDAKDGKIDGKISANVWNEFVNDKGGKTIKQFITTADATKSISVYLAKNSQATGKSKEGLVVEWIQQEDNSPQKIKKMKDMEKTLGFEAQAKKAALTPEQIKKDANYVVEAVTGKSEGIAINYHNAAQVFLKASEKFKDGKFPKSIGTTLYLMHLYPDLIKKAKELGIATYYKEEQKFGDINEKLAACRDLAYQIIEKEKGIPQNKII